MDSYRRVTLTSMDFLVLERLQPVFMEAGLPHVNQSAYRKAVSCAVAMFATQGDCGQVSQRWDSCLYMCLYDLQKAFDLVE